MTILSFDKVGKGICSRTDGLRSLKKYFLGVTVDSCRHKVTESLLLEALCLPNPVFTF